MVVMDSKNNGNSDEVEYKEKNNGVENKRVQMAMIADHNKVA